ncbi:MAG: methionyl-tRNA formyltransferase [Spirochaetia bacterium]|nr:methionyl-tRNA formyltransferase [Spirochaetales bacterium]MDX9784391.1 methionyl-tRNA formyltransferase [Spirochaetia bacterium]
MRVLFAGSPAIAIPSLEAVAAGHELAGILCNPPSPQGRGKEILPTPVAFAAGRISVGAVPLFEFEKLGPGERQRIAELEPDILVAFAYGKLFGPKFLALFPLGGINIHPSLLPRHRGSSPIQQAILDGDQKTGVSVQRIAQEMDSGELLAVEEFSLEGRETAASLSERCARIGARLCAEVLSAIEKGEASGWPQQGEPTYCRKIQKEDGLVDWNRPALELDARIRAFDPWPGSFTFVKGQRLGILSAEPYSGSLAQAGGEALPNAPPGTIIGLDKARGIVVRTKEGCLALTELQLAGRKALSYKDFANGLRDIAGLVLG